MIRKVWSLLEIMQYFNVCHMFRALDLLEDVARRCEDVLWRPELQDVAARKNALITPEVRDHIKPNIQYLRMKCKECELTTALRRIDGPFRIGMQTAMTFEEVVTQIRELKRDVDSDLEFRRFTFIPTDKAALLDNQDDRWTKAWKAVPASEQDTRDANLAYAHGLYTASVFHSMRVAEVGLRFIAKQLRITITDRGKKVPVEYGTWDKVITQCKNKITDQRKLPKNAANSQRLQRYSDAADHCGYMKDIWRNDVSHARKVYIQSEALVVLDRVSAFMQFLANGETTK